MSNSFIMLCSNYTEKECLERNLFGDKESKNFEYNNVRIGDYGFLYNYTSFKLIGVFQATSKVGTYDPNAWHGGFQSQIKVMRLYEGEIKNAPDKLRSVLKLYESTKGNYLPSKRTFGPDITEKILRMFGFDPKKNQPKKEPTKKDHEESFGGEIVTAPTSSLNDVAGLDEIKHFIHQRIFAPFESRELASALGLKIGGGIMLFGPPGTGKTLIAESIADSIDAKFFEISPSIICGFPGDAEKRIEGIFSKLNVEPRSVLFLDEAEWILNRRAEQSSTVMQRVTPVILKMLQDAFKESAKQKIIIAATNEPDKVDEAFLRPGRFDRIFYVRLPDEKARGELIRIHLNNRKNNISEEDIQTIVTETNLYSGADMVNLIEEAAYNAFSRRADENEESIMIELKDFEQALKKIIPSVTTVEMKKYEEFARKRKVN